MKLLCKKDLPTIFWSGEYYTANACGESGIYVIGSFHKHGKMDGTVINGYDFYFTNKPNMNYSYKPRKRTADYYYIWDYFYTPQEERKIKLEKLNEINL